MAGYTLNSLPAPPPAGGIAPGPANFGQAPTVRQEAAPGGAGQPFGGAFGRGFSARGTIRGQLEEGAKAGAFGPEYLRRRLLRRALLNRAAARRRAMGAAGLYATGDPYAARSAAIGSEIQSAGDFGNELSNADLSAYGGYQDYLRGQLGAERGYEDAAAQRAAEARAQSQGIVGQVGGYIGGKLLDYGLSYLPAPKPRK